eukprot:902859-Amphidinium_carterae.1
MDVAELDPFALERNGTLSGADAALAEVVHDAFVQAALGLLQLAIYGYPGAIRSMSACRNELLRAHGGRQDDAAGEAAQGSGQKCLTILS